MFKKNFDIHPYNLYTKFNIFSVVIQRKKNSFETILKE